VVRARILGSGTSNGVPMLGHEYTAEFLANPKNHRTRACLLLEGPRGNLLVDCPPELRLQLTGAGVMELEAVLITHTHADHIMGMDDLRSLCIKTQRAIPVYAYPEYQSDIRRVFNYAFLDHPAGVWVPRFNLQDVPEALEIGGMCVQTFRVMHGPWPVVGLRVGDFAYLTDVKVVPPAAMERLAGVQTLVVDAVRLAPHPTHFNLDEALAFAARIGAARTYLTHLSHDFDHDATNAMLPEGVQLAYDGLEIEVSVGKPNMD